MLSTETVVAQKKDISDLFESLADITMSNTYFSKVFRVMDDLEWTTNYAQFEGGTGTTWLEEAEPYPEVKPNDGYETSLTPEKLGNQIIVTKTMRRKAMDSTQKMREFVELQMRNQINDMARFLEKETHKMFTDYSSYLAPDTKPIFANNHKWNNDVAWDYTFDNLQTAASFSDSAVQAVKKYEGTLTDSTGTPIDIEFDTIITGHGTAAATKVRQYLQANGGQYETNSLSGVVVYNNGRTHIEDKYLKDDDNYDNMYIFRASRGRKGENSLVVVFQERPTMGEPVVQSNESVVFPYSGFVKYGCVYMPLDYIYNAGA